MNEKEKSKLALERIKRTQELNRKLREIGVGIHAHQWMRHANYDWTFCRDCSVILNDKNLGDICSGPVKIGLREDENDR